MGKTFKLSFRDKLDCSSEKCDLAQGSGLSQYGFMDDRLSSSKLKEVKARREGVAAASGKMCFEEVLHGMDRGIDFVLWRRDAAAGSLRSEYIR